MGGRSGDELSINIAEYQFDCLISSHYVNFFDICMLPKAVKYHYSVSIIQDEYNMKF